MSSFKLEASIANDLFLRNYKKQLVNTILETLDYKTLLDFCKKYNLRQLCGFRKRNTLANAFADYVMNIDFEVETVAKPITRADIALNDGNLTNHALLSTLTSPDMLYPIHYNPKSHSPFGMISDVSIRIYTTARVVVLEMHGDPSRVREPKFVFAAKYDAEDYLQFIIGDIFMVFGSYHTYISILRHYRDLGLNVEWINTPRVVQLDMLEVFDPTSHYTLIQKILYFLKDTPRYKAPQTANGIVLGFNHMTTANSLERMFLAGNLLLGSTFSDYGAVAGIFATVRTKDIFLGSFFVAGNRIRLELSKRLADDFGYIITDNANYGRILPEGTLVRGEPGAGRAKYSAVEEMTRRLIKDMKKDIESGHAAAPVYLNHEVVFQTLKIDLNKYLEAIHFHDRGTYDAFMHMPYVSRKMKGLMRVATNLMQ